MIERDGTTVAAYRLRAEDCSAPYLFFSLGIGIIT